MSLAKLIICRKTCLGLPEIEYSVGSPGGQFLRIFRDLNILDVSAGNRGGNPKPSRMFILKPMMATTSACIWIGLR